MGSPFECYYRLFIKKKKKKKKHFSDTTPSFDESYTRGALSTNVLTTAEFCFLSAAQGDVKKAIYSTHMASETSFRTQKDLSYGILTICTCQSYQSKKISDDQEPIQSDPTSCPQNRFYTNVDANLYREQNHGANMSSDETIVYVLQVSVLYRQFSCPRRCMRAG